jgi:hypothetical protein
VWWLLVLALTGLRCYPCQHELVKSERDFYLKKLEEIAALVHESELSKTKTAQSSLLALSILDVLFATEEDEQEMVLF